MSFTTVVPNQNNKSMEAVLDSLSHLWKFKIVDMDKAFGSAEFKVGSVSEHLLFPSMVWRDRESPMKVHIQFEDKQIRINAKRRNMYQIHLPSALRAEKDTVDRIVESVRSAVSV